jgi:hypothetical protein
MYHRAAACSLYLVCLVSQLREVQNTVSHIDNVADSRYG